MAEQNIIKAKKYATGDDIMNDYVKESEDVIINTGFGESYDHEWALKDQGRREGLQEGIEQGKKEGLAQGKNERNTEIAISMLNEKIDIKTIVKCTGLTEEEINKL